MREKVAALLKEHEAELVRNRTHQIWRLPNGRLFVQSNTPSDRNAERNSITHLRRLLGIKRKGGDGVRRERKLGGGRDRTEKYERSVNTALADQLRLTGLTEQGLRDDIEMLTYQNDMLSAANDELVADINAIPKPQPCWFCRLKEWWRGLRK